jgi:pimeloyl-ACP methyl ester carboxylesterase
VAHDYDWRKHEAALNRWPQFETTIDGQRLHFVHAKSKRADAFPLVVTHGWPGSIVEFQKLLPLLADDFHVVCPSLPGYGFSGPTRERGWDTERIAKAEVELMRRLGYTRYGAQGGDWGAIVTSWIGKLDPAHCAGIHLNMLIAPPPPDAKPEALAPESSSAAPARSNEGAATRRLGHEPQTQPTGSPTPRQAWRAGSPEVPRLGRLQGRRRACSRDELLTPLYWVTPINSSMLSPVARAHGFAGRQHRRRRSTRCSRRSSTTRRRPGEHSTTSRTGRCSGRRAPRRWAAGRLAASAEPQHPMTAVGAFGTGSPVAVRRVAARAAHPRR